MPRRDESSLSSLKSIRDDELLRRLSDLVKQSRSVEADVVAHVAEVERRRLYARQACSSMFEYCRRVLGLRENEAYLRITVARASRQHPLLLEMLEDGRLHLSGIARLTPHLTRENADALLDRACGMSHREVRELVAELEPKPDVASTVRKLPERAAAICASPLAASPMEASPMEASPEQASPEQASPRQLGAPRVESDAVSLDSRPAVSARALGQPLAPARRPAVVEPLAPSRYQVRFTASEELRDKLERLQALMRSSVPDGDLGRIIDIAISEKLERIEARRFGRTKTSPKARHSAATSTSSVCAP